MASKVSATRPETSQIDSVMTRDTPGYSPVPRTLAGLASLEAAKLQAQIDSIKNESFVRIQIMKQAHESSEDRFYKLLRNSD